MEALALLVRGGLDLHVVLVQTLVQSRTASKRFEKQVGSLRELTGGQLVVIPESGLLSVIHRIDLVLVGAQAISQNCGLINLIGTS